MMTNPPTGIVSRQTRRIRRCCAAVLFPVASLASLASADARTVAFGPGYELGPPSEIVVRKVESFRVGRRSNSNALTRTYTVASDDLSSERRVQARLTGIRLGSGSKPNDVARLSGETEVFLIDALRSVPVLVTYDEQGRIQGIDGWEHTQRAALDAVAGRIASLQSGAVALHGDARLAANAVAAIDAEVAGGLVRAITNAGPREFMHAFYDEFSFLFLVAGRRIAVGESFEHSIPARNPADGKLALMTYVLRLRKVDARRSTAQFDIKLAGDGIEELRRAMTAKLEETNLTAEQIAQKVGAMPMHWDTEGTAIANIASGRLTEVRVKTRIQVDNIELTSSQEIDIR